MDTAMNIKAFTLLLMILLYVDVSAAAKLTVYRWVDKNNIVHFSQNQPDHDNYIEMSMTNNKSLSTVVNKKNHLKTQRQIISLTLIPASKEL